MSRHAFAEPFSERRIRTMSDEERKGPTKARRVLASEIVNPNEQQRLTMSRNAAEVCLECGSARERGGNSYLCAECRKQFPKITEIGKANGWSYQVHALGFPYMGEYRVVRRDNYGEGQRFETLAYKDTEEDARKYAESRVRRGRAAANQRMW